MLGLQGLLLLRNFSIYIFDPEMQQFSISNKK